MSIKSTFDLITQKKTISCNNVTIYFQQTANTQIRMKLNRLIFIIASILSISFAVGQNNHIRVSQTLDITNGLAHNGVSCMLIDSRGYTWIGTYDGLNRYSGDDITIYKNQLHKNIFQNNRILSIAEDRLSRLWIGTESGVTIFDYEKYIFQQLFTPADNPTPIVKNIFIDPESDKIVCVSKLHSIIQYSYSGELLRSDALPQGSSINAAIRLDDDTYLLACNIGLMCYNANSGEISVIKNSAETNTQSVIKCNDNTIIASYDKGIQMFCITQDDKIVSIEAISPIEYDYASISAMAIDYDDTLWLGCAWSEGLYTIQNFLDSFGREPQYIQNTNRISNILIDGDCIWVSSLNDGVTKLLTNKTNFRYFSSDSIELPQVIAYDSERVIINSIDNPLQIYNIVSEQEETLPFEINSQLMTRYKYITKDRDDSLWIIFRNGVKETNIYNINGSNVTKLTGKELQKLLHTQRICDTPVNATFDGDNNLWVAYQNDLFRIILNPNHTVKRVESIWSNPMLKDLDELSRIRKLYFDEVENILWIGTNRQGLFKLGLKDTANKKLSEIDINNFTHEANDSTSLSSNFVSDIIRTTDGTLWVGTEQGGICRVDESNDTLQFNSLSEHNGLSNNVVKSIQEDHRGNLWIGTNIGLNCFNVKAKNFITYRSDKGLPFDGFWYSSLTLDGGDLLFVGTKQLLTFNPEVFYVGGSTPNINFDDLMIFDDEITPNEPYQGRIITNHQLKNGDTIYLNWNQNVFSIGVDIIRSQYSLGNTLFYRLSPINKRWIKVAENNNTLPFNGVNPGRYTLEVCTFNSQGERGDISSLHIVITPPFWKSTNAYIIYTIIMLLIIGIIIHTLLSFQSLNHHLEIQTIEKSVNEDKLRYFSNISHELKTPLSLILAPTALLAEKHKTDNDTINKLNIIRRQSKKLLDLVELTHGIEANDLKTLKPIKSVFSFNDMVRDFTNDFNFISQYDNKVFVVKECDKDVVVEADRGMIEKIVNNLLSNALKHTASGDTITILYNQTGDSISLIVSDSGYGIDAEDLPHIFERFYQAKRSGSHNIGGTGIGLTFSKMLVELHNGTIEVASELNIGTTFTINLPIVTNKHLPGPIANKQEITGDIIDDDDSSDLFIESEYAQSTIYIVEDNQELRCMLREVIGKHFNVKEFQNGQQMIESLDSEWPDLIVSDVMMPEMDGYELCNAIKSDIKTSHIPVILLTACSTIDDKIKGLQLGADAYIPKPFYPRHLITRIEMLLHNRVQLRERFQIGIPFVYGKDNNTSAKDNEFMSQLYDLFNRNLSNEDIDLDMIARELGQNRTMFFKKVKIITNTSPYELLKEYRLKKAAEMLQSGEYNVSEVCMLTGFKGRSHFSRLFKDRYNVSPSKYATSKDNDL